MIRSYECMLMFAGEGHAGPSPLPVGELVWYQTSPVPLRIQTLLKLAAGGGLVT